MKPLSQISISIVGLGLMGGSLAMALRPHVASIGAVDTNRDTLEKATSNGLVDWATDSIPTGIGTADLIILATPVRTILRVIKQLPSLIPRGCAILDIGSTKMEIVRAMSGLPVEFEALGGHPMCGRETSGLDAATDSLYRNKTFVLCRSLRTTARLEERVNLLVEALGAKPLHLPADVHDTLVGVTSHLPYLLSALLIKQATTLGKDDERLWSVTASGFRDTSRLSGSNPMMMLDILMTNRAAITEQLAHYREMITILENMLLRGEESAVLEWMEEAFLGYKRYKYLHHDDKLLNVDQA